METLELSWSPQTFEPGDVVVRAGDPADAFYVIVHGRAGVMCKELGRTLREGDYFGEIALIDEGPRSATVIAVDELRVIRIPKVSFLTLLVREPAFARRVMASLAKHIRRLESAPVAKERAPSSWPIPGLS
jgi:CRP-like cAMP-binding protein